MKQITNVRDIKKKSTEGKCIVGEMDDMTISIGLNGEEQTATVLGLFKVDEKYYATLLVSEGSKEVVVIYEVVEIDGQEHIQIIESKEQWDIASKAWSDIIDVAETIL